MQITHTLTSDFPELKKPISFTLCPNRVYLTTRWIWCCATLYYIEEFLTVGCVIVMLLAKRKLVYHVFSHVSNKGKNTQQ